MYAFKVVATTLQMLMMIVITCAVVSAKATDSTKRIAGIMLLISTVSVVAIWG